MDRSESAVRAPSTDGTLDEFERVLGLLEDARPFAKGVFQSRLLGLAQRLLQREDGPAAIFAYAPRFDAAGVFAGSDWDSPERLQPTLVRQSLTGIGMTSTLECLSELRFLAIAEGHVAHAAISAAEARDFLEDAIARNLDLLYREATEESRAADSLALERVERVLAFCVDVVGSAGIFDSLIDECERILRQRPVMVQRVERMLKAVERGLGTAAGDEHPRKGEARFLLGAIHGPSLLAQQHGDPEAYGRAIEGLGGDDLATEAETFGRRMDLTGIVCPLHAVLLHHLAKVDFDLLSPALALNEVGRTSLEHDAYLVRLIIKHAVQPETARCIYGLSRLLNQGVLFFRPVAPGLQRLMLLPVLPAVAEQLRAASELDDPPSANALLLAGTLSAIGQPRGLDQGHNPTCQAARAISLWAQNDVGFLLELIAHAARDGDVVMHFEGDAIRSSDLEKGLAKELHTELDPVSLVLTPHLDRIYIEMGRRTIGRAEDAHKWVNPEFHGWWVYRGFASLLDPASGAIRGFDEFVRLFYAAYHPLYNGGRAMVYAQPCGIVSTNANAVFVGWHAISIQRIDLDPDGTWRVYFFNPNRDKGQNWGQGIVTSTHEHGELEGESSLPFEQFLARLYLFHYSRRELGDPADVPADLVSPVRELVAGGWGATREWGP